MAQCTPKSFDLTGKVALITGASYGIGMAIAKAMAANGATIVFNDIKQELVRITFFMMFSFVKDLTPSDKPCGIAGSPKGAPFRLTAP